ncbi:hypothetical protein KW797_02500 [Candidatus Parcubacteria bacterium]|nr:hypothetical protein [Candidatus Parcubacteria bacterium]
MNWSDWREEICQQDDYGDDGESETPFPPGSRVYHRKKDLFAVVIEVAGLKGGLRLVKYEWPYDDKAPPVFVPLDQLSNPPR